MAQSDTEGAYAGLLQAGWQALRQGAWEEARRCFQAALTRKETPEALEGLGWAAWWLNDLTTLLRSREGAYRLYRERGDRQGAGRLALWLSSDYLDFRGEPAIANGWRQRAKRILDRLGPVPEHGWLALLEGDEALLMHEDTTTAKHAAQQAIELGRLLKVPDLEMLGLAQEGIALVSEGQVAEGMARLDEAATAAMAGEFKEVTSITWALCYLIYACERVRDYERAAQWCERMWELAARFQFHFAAGICRAHYGGILTWRGRWEEAEAELSTALEDLMGRKPYVAEGLVRLGELRRRQGRLDEAVALFQQAAWHPLALLGLAEIALEKEEPREAQDYLDRVLRHVPLENKTQRAAALEILVRVYAKHGEQAKAGETLAALQSVAETINTQPLRAAVSYAAGVVAAAEGDHEEARRRLEDSTHLFERSGAPYEAAQARMELAKALLALGRPGAAEREARLTQERLAGMGASAQADRAAGFLRHLGTSRQAPHEAREALGGLTPRELEVLRLVAQGLRDKEIATQLMLSEHTVHRHISNILTKLGVPSRAAAVAYAVRRALV